MSVKRTPKSGETLIFDRRVLLLVEGPDDQSFAAKQITTTLDADAWHIHVMVGKDSDWVNMIEIAMDDNWFSQQGTAVGVMLDADTDVEAAADKARGIFRRAGLEVPSVHGATVSDGVLKTGFFLAPDGTQIGALEELIIRGIDPARRASAESYISNISAEFEAPKHPLKAVLQAYFAGLPRHIKSIPVAVEITEAIPAGHPEFKPLRDFLEDLQTRP